MCLLYSLLIRLKISRIHYITRRREYLIPQVWLIQLEAQTAIHLFPWTVKLKPSPYRSNFVPCFMSNLCLSLPSTENIQHKLGVLQQNTAASNPTQLYHKINLYNLYTKVISKILARNTGCIIYLFIGHQKKLSLKNQLGHMNDKTYCGLS